jgi:hypothetical protein
VAFESRPIRSLRTDVNAGAPVPLRPAAEISGAARRYDHCRRTLVLNVRGTRRRAVNPASTFAPRLSKRARFVLWEQARTPAEQRANIRLADCESAYACRKSNRPHSASMRPMEGMRHVWFRLTRLGDIASRERSCQPRVNQGLRGLQSRGAKMSRPYSPGALRITCSDAWRRTPWCASRRPGCSPCGSCRAHRSGSRGPRRHRCRSRSRRRASA